MRRWKRPHRATVSMISGVILFGSAVAVMLLTIVGIAIGEYAQEGLSILGAVVYFGGFVLVLTFLWRRMRAGLYLSEDAVRVSHVFRTRTIPWEEINTVDSRPARMPLFGGDTSREAIWILMHDGTEVETPIQRSLGLTLFTTQRVKNNGVVLGFNEYGEVLDLLRAQRSDPG
jgi:hypothetical protein